APRSPGPRSPDAQGGRLPDRQPDVPEPAWIAGDGQPVSAGEARQGDAGLPERPQPSRAEDPGRAAGHGPDVGAGRLPGPGDGPARPRRTPAASLPHRGGLPRVLPPVAAGLLLPLQPGDPA